MSESVLSKPDSEYINDLMKRNRAGFWCLCSFHDQHHSSTFARYGKDINKLIRYAKEHTDFNNRNWYLSQNTLRTWHRNNSNVIGLNGLFIDVDCKKYGIDQGEMLFYLSTVLNLANLPEPNVRTNSGHGIYIKWYFDHQVIANSPRILNLWHKLEETVVDRFNQACGDVFGNEIGTYNATHMGDTKATDTARVLRIINSWNVKKSKRVRSRLVTYRPDLPEYDMFKYWTDKQLPPIHYSKPRKHGKRTYHKNLKRKIDIQIRCGRFTPFTLNLSRIKDLLTWARLAHYDINGARDEFVFLYACCAVHCESSKSVIKDMRDLNNKLKDRMTPTRINELVIEFKHIDFKKYRFNNASIIKKLGITPDQERHLKTIISYNESYRRRKIARRKANSKKHRKYIKDLNARRSSRSRKIIKLHNRGISYNKIAKLLRTSKTTVSSTIKRYNESGTVECPLARKLMIHSDVQPTCKIQLTRNSLLNIKYNHNNSNHQSYLRDYIDKVIRSPS